MNENEHFSWKMLMKPASDDQPTMRTPALVGIVVALHVLAVGAFLFIQGCGTVQPGVQPGARTRDVGTATRPTARVEPPPPPVMPPRAAPASRVDVPRPGLRPNGSPKHGPTGGFYFQTAMHHTSGALPLLFEFPHGMRYKPYTFDEILDVGLTMFEEVMRFGLLWGFRPS